MMTLRLACCLSLIAALATGCASAPADPVTSGRSPDSASHSPRVAPAALPTSQTDAASRTPVGSVTSPPRTPAPSATAAAVELPANGVLAAGKYYTEDRAYTNADRLTFTVPAGWTTEDYVLYKDPGGPGEVKLITWVLTHVFSDVCQWGRLVDAGTTVDQFASALMQQEGWQASAPTDLTVGGFPAKRVELTVAAELDTKACTNGVLRYWPGPGPDLSDGDCCNPPGNTDAVYAVNVAGNRLVIIARHYPGSSAEDRAELEGIVDSIEIEP